MNYHITNKNINHCSITWEISNKCNYSCWYCPDHLHNGTSGWPNLEKSINFLKNVSKKHEKVHIDLIGGEPTLWPKIDQFIDSLNDNISIEITTNGSRTLRWWEKLSPKVKTVSISAHLDTASLEHILQVCEILKSKVNLVVLFLFDPKHKDKIEKMTSILKTNNISHVVKVILPNFDGEMFEYTQEEIDFCNNTEYWADEIVEDFKPIEFFLNNQKKNIQKDILINNLNNFNGWKCRAGNKRLHIDFNGTVWAGSCRSYNLGNINEEVNLIDDYVICNKKSCVCLDDIRTEKWILVDKT